jgi:sorbitol-specific phosphotransferase system component IIA
MANINSQATTKDKLTITKDKGQPEDQKEFTVISEAGLFKNGKHYKTGSKISLGTTAATNFLNNKDIK